jgi:Penicillin-insensitive murein endopeptidase
MAAHATALFEAPAAHEVDAGQPASAWEAAATRALVDPRVDTPLPRENAGLVSYQREPRQYGRAEMIRALQAVGAAWKRAHPTGPRIGIGDISLRGGGPMPPHVSHQRGLDVDIRLVRADGREAPVRYQDAGYSRALTQQLVNIIRTNPVLPVEFILFNDPAVTGVKKWKGHDNHLHVRFRVPGATPRPPAKDTPRGSAADAAKRQSLEVAAVRSAIASGIRDENRLTDLIFYRRHPERGSRPLATGELTLQREWLAIREQIVRPALRAARPTGGSPAPAAQPAPAPAPGDGPPGPFGTLTLIRLGKPAWQYQFTPEDALWTARFIFGEAGGRDTLDNRAVIWAMFNRWALFTSGNPKYDRCFHKFIRAYSTPLQPVLNSGGAAKRHMHKREFVRVGGTYNKAPYQDVPRGQLERHLRLQRTPWRTLPEEARSLAERALRGEVPNPGIGIASDFDNTAVYFKDRHGVRPRNYEEWRAFTERFARENCHKQHRGCTWIGRVDGLDQVGKNAFFIDNRVRDLPASAVQVIRPR